MCPLIIAVGRPHWPANVSSLSLRRRRPRRRPFARWEGNSLEAVPLVFPASRYVDLDLDLDLVLGLLLAGKVIVVEAAPLVTSPNNSNEPLLNSFQIFERADPGTLLSTLWIRHHSAEWFPAFSTSQRLRSSMSAIQTKCCSKIRH